MRLAEYFKESSQLAVPPRKQLGDADIMALALPWLPPEGWAVGAPEAAGVLALAGGGVPTGAVAADVGRVGAEGTAA